MGLGHLDPSTRVLLKRGDRLATFADNGPGGHGWHQDLHVKCGIACNVQKERLNTSVKC